TRAGRVRAGPHRERRPGAAREFYSRTGAGVVQSPRAGAHSPADAGTAAARDRARYHGRFPAVSFALATPRPWRAVAWRRRIAASDPSTARLRDLRGRVGKRDSSEAHRPLHAGSARPALPFG